MAKKQIGQPFGLADLPFTQHILQRTLAVISCERLFFQIQCRIHVVYVLLVQTLTQTLHRLAEAINLKSSPAAVVDRGRGVLI